MTDLPKATASLIIEVNVECPKCEEHIDLMESTPDRYYNEDGHVMKQACPDGCWHTQHKDFSVEVTCPKCNLEFEASGIDW